MLASRKTAVSKQLFKALLAELPEVLRQVAARFPGGEEALRKGERIVGSLVDAQLVEHLLCEFRKALLPRGRQHCGQRTPRTVYRKLWGRCRLLLLARRKAKKFPLRFRSGCQLRKLYAVNATAEERPAKRARTVQ